MIEIKYPINLEKVKQVLEASGFQANKKFWSKINNRYTDDDDSYRLSFKYNNTNISFIIYDNPSGNFEDNVFSNTQAKFYNVDSKNKKIILFDDELKIYYDDLANKRKNQKLNKSTSSISKIILDSFIDGHLRNKNIKFEKDETFLPATTLVYICSASKIKFFLSFSFKSYKEMTNVNLKYLTVAVGNSKNKINFQKFIDNFELYLNQAKEIRKTSAEKKNMLSANIKKLNTEIERQQNLYEYLLEEDFLTLVDFSN